MTSSLVRHLVTCAAVLTTLATPLAIAQSTDTPVIDKRQQRLDRRIAQGEAKGQISAQEAARLKARQQKIEGMKQAARADGKVTAAERKSINQAQTAQSRHVYNQRRDGNKR